MLFWAIYALLGFGSVIFELKRTGHAKWESVGKTQDSGCPDRRVEKLISTLGGAASFSFGWPYFVLSFVNIGWLTDLALAYGIFQFVSSAIQSIKFIRETVRKQKTGELNKGRHCLMAHIGKRFDKPGCGSATGKSPFWFLYWLAIPFSADSMMGEIIGWFRDGITLIEFLASLPAILIISAITWILARVFWVPKLTGVDRAG